MSTLSNLCICWRQSTDTQGAAYTQLSSDAARPQSLGSSFSPTAHRNCFPCKKIVKAVLLSGLTAGILFAVTNLPVWLITAIAVGAFVIGVCLPKRFSFCIPQSCSLKRTHNESPQSTTEAVNVSRLSPEERGRLLETHNARLEGLSQKADKIKKTIDTMVPKKKVLDIRYDLPMVCEFLKSEGVSYTSLELAAYFIKHQGYGGTKACAEHLLENIDNITSSSSSEEDITMLQLFSCKYFGTAQSTS